MLKVVLTLALLGVAAAELTCEECSMIGTDYSAHETSPEAIQRQIDLIQQPVCHKAPNPEECNTHLPDFWKAIAMALFNPDNGWFSPSEFCAGVCVKKSLLGEFFCRDCMMALDDSFRAMGNKQNQEQVVLAFTESTFCADFAGEENMDMCMQALDFVIPEAMTLLAGQGHMFTNEFCVAEGCV